MPGSSRPTVTSLTASILRYRWAIVVLVALLSFGWQAAPRAGEASGAGAGVWLQVLLQAALLPLSLGALLALLAASEHRRRQAEASLQQQTALGEQLYEAYDWQALLQCIVRYPAGLLPVKRSELHLYNAEHDCFELAAAWPQEKPPANGREKRLALAQCQPCLAGRSPVLAEGAPCQPGSQEQLCLPLAHAGPVLALLRLELETAPGPHTPGLRQLHYAAHDMALALEWAQLKRLASQQSEATLAERRRIAQNLHDTLGQNISYLRLKLDQLTGEDAPADISEVKQELERMREIADDAYNQVRGTLAELHPTANADLAVALVDQARAAGARSGFRVELTTAGQPLPLPPHTKRQILFIAKEALNNVEKYARAHQVALRLDWKEHELAVFIHDDGCGFDAAGPGRAGHYGLAIMNERANDIHGRLRVRSTAGQGTEVTLRVPLGSHGAAAGVRAAAHRN